MLSEDLNTTKTKSEEFVVGSYEDSEDIRARKAEEEQRKFDEVQREHDLEQAEMIDNIRALEMELRELEAAQRLDEEADNKPTSLRANLSSIPTGYIKLTISCIGMFMTIMLVFLVLTFVDSMLAEPELVEVVEGMKGSGSSSGGEETSEEDSASLDGEGTDA